MRKWLNIMAGLILTAALAAGCSSGSPTKATSGDTKNNEADKKSNEPVTITMAVGGDQAEQNMRKETGNAYTKLHPNVTIKWVDLGSKGSERKQKLLTLISGGQAPDLFYMNEWAPQLAAKSALMPLDPLIKGDPSFKLDEFYQGLIDGMKYDGKLYALPQEVSPLVIYYNKDMFEKNGVPLPKDNWTMDEFLSAAKKLTDPGKKQYGYLLENWWGGYGEYLLNNGGSFFTSDFKKSGFDAPGALDTLKMMKKMVVDDHISPNSAELGALGQGVDALFRNQKVAMMDAGLWWLPGFKAQPLSFKWDVVRVPSANGKQIAKGATLNWGISATTKHQKEAWDVLKFFVGPEGMKVVAKYNMALPGSKDKVANQMILDSKFPENIKAFIDSAALINTEESFVKAPDVFSKINPEIDKMLLGKQSPEDTQKIIVDLTNQVLAQ